MKTPCVIAFASALIVAACDQGGGGSADAVVDTTTDPADATGDADVPADSDAPADVPTDIGSCSCTAGEGCLRVTITRASDDSMQPWVVWPSEADGTGTLILSAVSGTTTLDRETVAGASYVPAEASFGADLCVAPGTVEVRAFLDDDGDAAPDATYSADYLDSCLGENDGCFRCVNATVAAGEVLPVEADLVGSCD